MTADPKGTAYAAFQGFPLDTIPVAGKTGTAQVGAGRARATRRCSPRTSRPTRRSTSSSRSSRKAGCGAQTAAPIVRRVIEAIERPARRRAGPGARHGPGLMATITGGYSARGAGARARRARCATSTSCCSRCRSSISALGLLMIYSSTRSRLERNGVDPLYYVERQGLAIVLGVVAMVVVIVVDYRRLRDLWALVYLAVLPLLVGVLVLGATRKGAQAWFQVGPLQFQPSEIAKIVVIIAVAGYCHQHRGDLDAWRLAVAIADRGGADGARVPAARPRHDARDRRVRVRDPRRRRAPSPCTSVVLLLLGVTRGRRGGRDREGSTPTRSIASSSFLDQSTGDSRAASRRRPSTTSSRRRSRSSTGGLARRGPVQRPLTKNRVRARAAHRLHLHRGGRGARLPRWRDADRALRIAGVAPVAHRACCRPTSSGRSSTVGVLAMFAFQVFENIGMTMGIMPITGHPAAVHVVRRLGGHRRRSPRSAWR